MRLRRRRHSAVSTASVGNGQNVPQGKSIIPTYASNEGDRALHSARATGTNASAARRAWEKGRPIGIFESQDGRGSRSKRLRETFRRAARSNLRNKHGQRVEVLTDIYELMSQPLHNTEAVSRLQASIAEEEGKANGRPENDVGPHEAGDGS